MKRYLGQRKLLRIYIANDDTYDGKPLWELLLHTAQEMGIAGATVFKGVAGFGAHSEIHTFNIWVLKQKLPLVIEIIDEMERLRPYLEAIDDKIEEGFVTMSDLSVIAYKHPKHGNA
ncbi:DUF190 domain-containing protein [Hydrogenimonas sp.]